MDEQQLLRPLRPANDRKQRPAADSRPITAVYVKASSACKACRLRRSKCSTQTPCQACRRVNTECVYDESSDRRRKVAEKRTATRLAQSRDLLQSLLETLRFGNQDHIEQVLRAIRDDISLKDIVTTIQATRQKVTDVDPTKTLSLGELDDLTSDRLDDPCVPIPPRIPLVERVLSLQELCCESPFDVRGQSWTKVSDEKHVSYLINIYLTWEQPFFHLMDEESFLSDMAAGRSDFCSALLINVICAFTSRILEVNQVLNGAFWHETVKCFENERGRPSLTSVQALFLMFLHESSQGRDAIAIHYCYVAHDMYKRLKLDCRRPTLRDLASNADVKRRWHAVTTAAWGLFSVDTILSFYYGYTPQIGPPTMEKYFAHEIMEHDLLWVPYPSTAPARTARKKETLLATSELSELFIGILHHIRSEHTAHGSVEDVEKRIELYSSLLELRQKWPLSVAEQIELPSHSFMLMDYFNMVAISIWRPLQVLPNISLPGVLVSPRHLSLLHATELVASMSLFRSTYSLKYAGSFAAANPYLATFTLVPQLNLENKAADLFTKACQHIRELASKMDVLRYTLLSLQAYALLCKVQIPHNALQYFQGLGLDDVLLENIPINLLTAELPPEASLESLGMEDEGCGHPKHVLEAESMRELLARWNKLNMHDQGSGSARASSSLSSSRASPP